MPTEIIIALISSAGGVIVGLIGVWKGNSLIAYKVDRLSNHVEKHNQVVERTYNLEKIAEVQCEQIKVINHRLEDLEEFKK